ncbi:MAG: ribonuclease P protein component [Bacteroidota bacterium]|nr:ribonuclease P protein component [Bacteroidota bacterium]MDP4226186.1 ribonuclease P protein component [Bacteroidota bacterium]MDP4274190.1 ribonuclease P protein component [Bacteroidota bacterium]
MFTFTKEERIRGKKSIDSLFKDGFIVMNYPLKVVWKVEKDNSGNIKAGVSVPKKFFKRAVRRNLIKRRIKESFRLNKPAIKLILGEEKESLSLMFIYISKEIIPYREIEKKVALCLQTITEQIKKIDEKSKQDV